MERFVKILGYSMYEISDRATIKYVGDTIFYKNGNVKILNGQTINCWITDGGRYVSCAIWSDGFKSRDTFKVHRLVFFSFNPDTPLVHGNEVDHIDNNRLNNWLSNLQYITHSKNIAKFFDKAKTTSRYTGVYWNRRQNVWSTMISYKNKRYFVGNFIDEDRAGLAYQNAYSDLQLNGHISSGSYK